MRGDAGADGFGRPGNKGTNGQKGFPGAIGQKGDIGNTGISGEHGPKGIPGQMAPTGTTGLKGTPGDQGPPGYRGVKGVKGVASFSPCELIAYIRKHSSCYKGTMECPVHPTELLFALDVSRDTTSQLFERMKEIIITIVNDTKIRESNCPVGARVAVVSYSSSTQHLIRFSDFHTKNQLLQELKALPYRRSTDRRDIGGSMRYVARNIFKRTLQGANVRKIAVFFSNGQSSTPLSINTAVLEFSALDIIPVVIAFKNIPEVSRAFEIDDSGQFHIIDMPDQGDYKSSLHRLQLCTICYDKCEPSAACELTKRIRPPEEYMDVAFIFDNSRMMSHGEFEKMKDFLNRALENLDVSSKPATSSIGDRVAVVSYATPMVFQLQAQKTAVKTEFDLVTYTSTQLMKEHIRESVHQLNGGAAVGLAIQWTINQIFSEAPRPRKHKAIIVISAGETSPWDKEELKKVSLRAKCQGYALWVLSLGQTYNSPELEELASLPLEQHLIQLGRIHKPELEYAVMFLRSFLRLLRNAFHNYPPAELRTKCKKIISQASRYSSRSLI